ncbi:hypothetical protein QE152_g30218 [Popillia japonica]|uniref:Uncharacterized protein n=1 Tax=Popillia japonica TaxID=7064 RepID=A0AAW1JF32_POPJA
MFNANKTLGWIVTGQLNLPIACHTKTKFKNVQCNLSLNQQIAKFWEGQLNLPIACHTKTKFKNVQCNLSLNQQIAKFWELEEIPAQRRFSLEEQFCESHFKETTKRDDTGRFIVKLPFKQSVHNIGESEYTASKRLQSIENKFKINDNFKQLYLSFMREYETLDHMSLVKSSTDESPVYYLPHHAVLKDSNDLLTGVDTVTEAITLGREISSILLSGGFGGFELCKWSSNDTEISAQFSTNNRDNDSSNEKEIKMLRKFPRSFRPITVTMILRTRRKSRC